MMELAKMESAVDMLWKQENSSKWGEESHVVVVLEPCPERETAKEVLRVAPETEMKLMQRKCSIPPEGSRPEILLDFVVQARIPDGSLWLLFTDWAREKPIVRFIALDQPLEDCAQWEVVESRDGLCAEMKHRMTEVVGFCNFSFLLRNCEHVMNYVWFGRWFSHQAQDLAKSLRAESIVDSLFSRRPKGLAADSEQVMEINVVFYGKVSCGKSQLLRGLLSEATGQTLPMSQFKISPVGGSTVSIKSYFYESMTLHTEGPISTVTNTEGVIPDGEGVRSEGEIAEPKIGSVEAEKIELSDGTGEAVLSVPKTEGVTLTRKRARVVFWDTPGIGLTLPSGKLGFEEIKKTIDSGVKLVDLCVFVFNGDGKDELYGPYMDMVKQICAMNGYKKGSPEYNRAARRVILVRTHGDAFEWDESSGLQEQFDSGKVPEDLEALRASIASRLNARLKEEGFIATIKPADICHVSTRAFMPDYDASPLFQQMYDLRTYGLRTLLDKIFATATGELSLILLEKHRKAIASVASGIAKELMFGSIGGMTAGLGAGGMAIGAYAVFETMMATMGVNAALGFAGTAAVVGLPVVAGTMVGGLVAAAYKRHDIQKVLSLRQEEAEVSSSVNIAGFDEKNQSETVSDAETAASKESPSESVGDGVAVGSNEFVVKESEYN